MPATEAVVRGEIAEVEQRGASEGAARVVRFERTREFKNRPMQKEYVELFGVEFQIKKIIHRSGVLMVKFVPATVMPEMFEAFLADAERAEWKIETVH